jgi:uncharacterized membrane protein YwzB
MIVTLLIVVGLGWWALQLMEQAFQRQEFSRMLAGMLVMMAAGGVLTTYFLFSDYIHFMLQGEALQTASQVSGEWISALE